MTLEIRQARLDDLDVLATLFDQYRVWYKQPSDIAGAHQFLQERMLLGESIIFIAFLEQRAVGFTQLYPSFSSVRMRRLWILNDLFVSETARGQQVGVGLLDAARGLAHLSDARGIVLETAATNLKAQHLYERYGFKRDNGVHYLLALQ